MIRLAAVGDVHCGTETREEVRSQFASVAEHADALLLAGDLTRLGMPDEAQAVEDAVEAALAKGVRTPDLAWVGSETPPMSDLPSEVEVGTEEMTQAVLAELEI